MNIAVVGATGFVGSVLVPELISRGHHVVAIARSVKNLVASDHLSVKLGNATDEAFLSDAVTGSDVVVSSFNPGWGTPDLYNTTLNGSTSILASVKNAHVRRLFVVGGAGGLETGPGVKVIDDPHFPDTVKPGAQALIDFLSQLRIETELDWTFLSPSAELVPGERTGKFRIGGDQLLVDADGKSHISVQDLAVAIADELEKPSHTRQRFTVGY